MKSSLLTVVFLFVSVEFVNALDDIGTVLLDKKRDAKLFTVTKRASGQYIETMKVTTDSHVSFGETSMDSTTTISTEGEVTVSDDAKTGGSHVTSTITRMVMDMETAGMKSECDTSVDKKIAGPLCDSLYDVLDKVSTFDLDKDGNIVSASGSGSELAKAFGTKQEAVATNSGSDDSDNSWIQSSRMLQLVPTDEKIKPGDKWNGSEDLGEMGQMTGTGTMLGYAKVDDVDCAVFKIVGTLHINMDKMEDMFSDNAVMASALHDTDMSDAAVDALIYYDYERGLVRWSKMHQTSTITMPDMTGEGKITIPTDSTTILTCKPKEE